MADETKLTRLSGEAHTFTSQSSATFTFRRPEGVTPGVFVPANPPDYLAQTLPVRGTTKPTIGGGRIIQRFGSYQNDEFITFTGWLTQDEIDDMELARAKNIIWTLSDYFGDSYEVVFALKDGLKKQSKIKANDIWTVKFKFRRIAKT